MWLDSHAHIACSDFEDINEIVNNARANNVGHICIVCCNLDETKIALELAERDNLIDVAVGFHPCDAHEVTIEMWKELEQLVQNPYIVAVGEIGLDYYWNKETSEIQKEVMIRQIDLANKYNKPIIVHSRDAINDTYELLQNNVAEHKGIIHCFSSSAEMANNFVKLGYTISLGGPVTFKNAKTPKEVAEAVPLSALLIETDCPYLTPHPYRGKRNEPAYVQYVGEEICKIKNISCEVLQKALNENYKNLFHKN